MITPAYVQRMARYNRWQNDNLYGCADKLPDAERKRDAGAFFGSIHNTLSHLVWADQTWMRRFEPSMPAPRAKSVPDSPSAYLNWDELKADRQAFDAVIIAWADRLPAAWLADDLTWTSSDGTRTSTSPKGMLLAHVFNHQTHHRGQVHCLLTQAGVKPADTDLPIMQA